MDSVQLDKVLSELKAGMGEKALEMGCTEITFGRCSYQRKVKLNRDEWTIRMVVKPPEDDKFAPSTRRRNR